MVTFEGTLFIIIFLGIPVSFMLGRMWEATKKGEEVK